MGDGQGSEDKGHSDVDVKQASPSDQIPDIIPVAKSCMRGNLVLPLCPSRLGHSRLNTVVVAQCYYSGLS